MRKPVFPRIIFITLLYMGIFVFLVFVQFGKQGSFTRKVGDFVVSGHYRAMPDDEDAPMSNEYYLEGDVNVLFGGMNFAIAGGKNGHPEDNSFSFILHDGSRAEMLPERMVLIENAAGFLFPDGTELLFTSQGGAAQEIRISASLSSDVTGIELPFIPSRRTSLRETESGQLVVVSGKINYSFGSSPIDSSRRLILFGSGGAIASYRAIPERMGSSPGDFILSQALSAETYSEFLSKWIAQNYSVWGRAIPALNNEDVVIAFTGEALSRGGYRTAVNSIPSLFLNGANRSYESSVYLGSLDQAYRSLSAAEREKFERLSGQINMKSLEFLLEPKVFEYFAVRGHRNLISAGADLIQGMDSGILSLDLVPGIFEGYMDWKIRRPGVDNPFERLVDSACLVILEGLRKTANTSDSGGGAVPENLVFVVYDRQGETEFNMRLGKALLEYAEASEDETWAAVARSMIISALSMGEASGPELSARLYRVLNPANTYPRALATGAGSVWAWTVANSVRASQQNDVLDITVNFPAGETHYMLIRGVRPFVRLQLYEMNFRTDPQFERYDSSGWSYAQQEQTLLVKMRHRSTQERIRIIFWEETQAEPVVSDDPNAAGAETVAP